MTSLTNINVTGLTFGMTYIIRVSANNSIGIGNSSMLTATTPGEGNKNHLLCIII